MEAAPAVMETSMAAAAGPTAAAVADAEVVEPQVEAGSGAAVAVEGVLLEVVMLAVAEMGTAGEWEADTEEVEPQVEAGLETAVVPLAMVMQVEAAAVEGVETAAGQSVVAAQGVVEGVEVGLQAVVPLAMEGAAIQAALVVAVGVGMAVVGMVVSTARRASQTTRAPHSR